MATQIHSSNLRISLLPLYRCLISRGSTNRCEQNCLNVQLNRLQSIYKAHHVGSGITRVEKPEVHPT